MLAVEYAFGNSVLRTSHSLIYPPSVTRKTLLIGYLFIRNGIMETL
jgi:hypothetical protein